jgi:hypothetical protein
VLSDISALYEKVLSQGSVPVYAALAGASYLAHSIVPHEWRWIAELSMIVFAALAIGKALDAINKIVRRYLARRDMESRRAAKSEEEKRRTEAEEARRQKETEEGRANVLRRLEYLGEDEKLFITRALRSKSQTLFCYIYSHPGRSLETKGLVISGAGTGNQDYWPWIFPDFVWEELLKRRDQFLQDVDQIEQAKKGRGRRT